MKAGMFCVALHNAKAFAMAVCGAVLPCDSRRGSPDLADRKTTMSIVTHEMHFARDVADRILFMDGGVVVEEGPARQLIDHPQEERTKQLLAHYSD